jgi:pimeloyl-ACP methyl ester carboxylesterase
LNDRVIGSLAENAEQHHHSSFKGQSVSIGNQYLDGWDIHDRYTLGEDPVKIKKTFSILSALAIAFAVGGSAARAQNMESAAPPAAIHTFSTSNVGRVGHFYVGGHYEGDPGKEVMFGAMYVDVIVPAKIRHPYPVIFICGGAGQTGVTVLETPDGRPGWAYDFVNQGYTVYVMDYPGRGRSLYVPNSEADGKLNPPRTAPLMEEVWSGGRPPSTPQSTWPQYTKQTQWPGEGPNKGKMGDPIFDQFASSEIPVVVGGNIEKYTRDAIIKLIDTIGHPVILLLHSGVSSSGWEAADARPKMIKGIVAAEPVAPPVENAERGQTGPGRVWGLTNLPVKYDPPVTDASELQPVRQEKADGPGLIPCYVQKEPAHKLSNLVGIPVLDVSGEASYHRPYSHCIAKWLNQAGVKTTYVNLEDVGLPGNGHIMMAEKNSAAIAKYLQSWIDKNVK